MSKTQPKTSRRSTNEDRTTVSFSPEIWKMIKAEMKAGGFNNNVSAFLAQCVRERHQRTAELQLAAPELSRSSGERTAKPGTIARRIINEVVKRSRDRSHGETASAFEVLQAVESQPRVIQGFAPPPTLLCRAVPANPSTRVVESSPVVSS